MAGRTWRLTSMDEEKRQEIIRLTENMRRIEAIVREDVHPPITGPFSEVRPTAHQILAGMIREMGTRRVWIASCFAVTPNYYIEGEKIDVIADDDQDTADRRDLENQDIMSFFRTRDDSPESLERIRAQNEPRDEEPEDVRVTISFGYDLLMMVPVTFPGMRGLFKDGAYQGVLRLSGRKRRSEAEGLPAEDLVEICLGRIVSVDIEMGKLKGILEIASSEDGGHMTIVLPLDGVVMKKERELAEKLAEMIEEDI